MNPWNIIGWGIVLVIAAPLVGAIAIAVGCYLEAWRRHLATRNTPPEAGQVWVQGDGRLHITRVTDEGRVVMQSRGLHGTASWSDSAEGWRDRVKNRRLYLRKEGK